MSSTFEGFFVKSFQKILNSTTSKSDHILNDYYKINENNQSIDENIRETKMDDIIIEKSLPINNYIRAPPSAPPAPPPIGRRQMYVVNNMNNNNRTVVGDEQQNNKKRDTKKWSFGGFFRRRKKSIETDSSSQDDTNKINNNAGGGFMSRKKKTCKKITSSKSKRKLGLGSTFDHIVLHPKDYAGGDAGGVMSDPNINYTLLHHHQQQQQRTPHPSANQQHLINNHKNIFLNIQPSPNGNGHGHGDDHLIILKSSHESLIHKPSTNTTPSPTSYGSLDSSTKKRARERARQRRVHRGATTSHDAHSSSEEDGSQRSTASSMLRIKSDSDSATTKLPSPPSSSSRTMDNSTTTSRKTRSARTERYIKRLSREDEHILNKEAELVKQQHVLQSPSSRTSKLPITSSSSHHNILSTAAYNGGKPPIFGSNGGGSHHDLNKNIRNNTPFCNFNDLESLQNGGQQSYDNYYMQKQKSWSYENNINCGARVPPTPPPPLSNYYYTPTPTNKSMNNPPTPPPRRIIPFENCSRPMSYAFENNQQQRNSVAIPTNHPQQKLSHSPMMMIDRTSSMRSINDSQRVIDRRSNSDDHITTATRTVEAAAPPKRFITRHPQQPHADQVKYQFYTDQIPRSRKPIHIVQNDHQYLSDSQVERHYYHQQQQHQNERSPGIQNATQFWKQKEFEEVQRRRQVQKVKVNKDPAIKLLPKIETPPSRQQSPSSPFDSLKRRDSNTFRPLSMVLEKPENHREPPKPPTRRSSRQSSTSSTEIIDWNNEPPRVHDERNKCTRKSTNLEDALNELEEIYKSLHLGDEDLLDRAERRDIPTLSHHRDNNLSSSTESFHEDPSATANRAKPTPRVSRRRSGVPDKITDDMAYRKLHRNDVSPSCSSPKDSILSQVSYLLASPDFTSESPTTTTTAAADIDPFNNDKEPDITLDDVVYRNIKHTNNQLKVIEPQPPFGIPIGPVTVAPSTDYLHAKPEQRTRSRFIPQRIPDIVKDDLAFRSLRKDQMKDPLLLSDRNNNGAFTTLNSTSSIIDTRKKRAAVRSLSANLYNIIQRDQQQRNGDDLEKVNLANVRNEFITTSTETLTSNCNDLTEFNNDKNVQHHRLRVYIPRGGSQESDTDIEITINKTSPRKISLQNASEMAAATPTKKLNQTHLETLLINLAKETQEESKKLEIELEKFENTPKSIHDGVVPSSREEHTKLCEKLLECVVESTDIISSSRFTSDNEEAADDRQIEELKQIDTISNMLIDNDNIDHLLQPNDNNQLINDIDSISRQAQICGTIIKDAIENIPEQIKHNRFNDIDHVSKQIKACGDILQLTVEHTPDNTTNTMKRLNDIDNVSNQIHTCGDILQLTVEHTPDNTTNMMNRLNDNVSNRIQMCGNILERVETIPNEQIVECVVQSTELIPIKPEKIELPPSDDDNDNELNNIATTPKIARAEIELATNIDSEMVEDLQFDNKCSELQSTIANVILVRKPDSPPLDLMCIDSNRLSIVKSDDYENLEDFLVSSTDNDQKSLFETEKQNIVDNFLAINQKFDQEDENIPPNISIDSSETQIKGSTRSDNNCRLFTRTCSSNNNNNCYHNDDDDNDNDASSSLWYKDSKIMALACAYALACTHQLATMDIITILGIILAVISLLFALIV